MISSVTCIPQTQTFLATGGGPNGILRTFTVPAGVCSVRIQAVGAVGGAGTPQGTALGGSGGLGASIQGEFSVTPGETLSILVGQRGTNGAGIDEGGGGGGGSFVWRGNGFAALNLDSLLIAAGGGGGGGDADETNGNPGVNATIPLPPSTSSNGTTGNPGGAGGAGGNGGLAGNSGSGGAGILTSGGSVIGISAGGQAIQAGAAGGTGDANGGFGGGGGSGAAGGGGGFNGGGGGGGGGGSFNSGTNQTNIAGIGSGDGTVVITTICC